ncbi:glycosyltransferase [bacterium]|nr:glycosyltransferase [bacterium]
MLDLTVVVPTFNERENVGPLLGLLTDALQGRAWEVIFVDDDSPDHTADAVLALAETHPNVRLLHRTGRRGLAGACIEGILSSSARFCAVIDADLQHDETRLPVMLDLALADPALDLVIGSRNVEGGDAAGGFSARRKWGSDTATALTKAALKITASDPMSGFFLVRRSSFATVADQLQVAGFKLLADLLSASRGRWKVAEVPYRFRQRQFGTSKMDRAVALEFLGLLVARKTGGLVSIKFVLFGMVGLLGVFVQLAVVGLALRLMPQSFALAQVCGVVVAIASNFTLNNALTYRDRALRGLDWIKGLASFYVVCSFGALMNVGLARLVYDVAPYWALASVAGAVAGAVWNFMASSLVTWKSR